MRRRPRSIFWVLIGVLDIGLVIVMLTIALRPQPSCCEQPPLPGTPFLSDGAMTTIAFLQQTQTRMAQTTLLPAPHDQHIFTETPPYNPTLYAERQAELKSYSTDEGLSDYVRFYATETALVSAYEGTPTASPATTALAPPYESCVWQWSQRDLPAIANLARIALSMYDVDRFTVRVQAYGENCLDSQGKLQYFGAMTTDFYVTAQTMDLRDEEALGGMIRDVYQALTIGLDPEWLPAPFGYLDITFSAGQTVKHFRVMFETIRPLLEQGLGGKALLEALGGVR